MTRKTPLTLYARYCQLWRFLSCCLDVAAGLPFLVAGLLLRFVREWFFIGYDFYDFLKEIGQEPKRNGANQ